MATPPIKRSATTRPFGRARKRLVPILIVGLAAAAVLAVFYYKPFWRGSMPPAAELKRPTENAERQVPSADGSVDVSDFDEFLAKQQAIAKPRAVNDENARSDNGRGPGSALSTCGEAFTDGRTQIRSLPNGAETSPALGPSGLGRLQVVNGTGEDAVVTVNNVKSNETIRSFYVRSEASVPFSGIPEGIYRIGFMRGRDWDGSDFRCEPSYSQFEDTFRFSELPQENGIKYSSISVTLHPVPNGNIHTRRMSKQEFLKLYTLPKTR